MRAWPFLISAACGLALVPAAGLAAEAPDLRVRPAFCLEPCTVRLTIVVDPHEADRELVVEADSGGFYRSSLIQLDGEMGPPVHTVMWKAIPAGVYVMQVTLRRSTGEVASTRMEVTVVGP